MRADVDMRQREDQLQGARAFADEDAVIIAVGKREAEPRTVSVRRLGSNAQTTLRIRDAAIAGFVEEATPPDLKRG